MFSDQNLPSKSTTLVALAPMMQRTDRHFRFMMRLLSPDLRLYTEMISAQALIHGDAGKILSFNSLEHPIALQLGGSDPLKLAEAAKIGADLGYDEINLNIGCPSDRVSSGGFGAYLMAQPHQVAECVAAIKSKVSLPVSVKTRCGIDDQDSHEFVSSFIETVSKSGCEFFILHARKAILSGLSPKENRNIPPLRYPFVYSLAKEFPHLRTIINGGIRELESIHQHMQHVDGVMIGRQAYKDPYWMAQLQTHFINDAIGRKWSPPSRAEVVQGMAIYAQNELSQGVEIKQIIRHMLGLYSGQSGARKWRRFLTEKSQLQGQDENLLLDSLNFVERS
ncbi:MAG: tRNA dihydrouridine(20/20a) synthase DusA [Pseudomonadota bacterium]|nr:tRNA dihydrouridine(20/20a) synthase DusA [Pseudomonadota bacterium]